MSVVHLSYLKTNVYQPEPILQIIVKIFPSGWCYSTCRGQGVTHYYGNLTKWLSIPQKSSFLTLFWNFRQQCFVLSCYLLYEMVRNGELAFIFVPRNGNPSSFVFFGRVRNGIPRACFHFCSTERNSELLSLLRKGSERNSEIFCFAEQPEFRRK